MATHVGLLIKTYFESLPRYYTVKHLAEQLNCNRRNIYNIFGRSTIDIELLWRISKALDHNFFEDLSRKYEELQSGGESTCRN